MAFLVSRSPISLTGSIRLNGSKSITNRALIVQALCRQPCRLHHMSDAADSQKLLHLLQSGEPLLDAGAGGTTFRFLTAFMAIQPGTRILTGSDRMKQRPVGPLVRALQQLGAEIAYLEKVGYPPIRIDKPASGQSDALSIQATVSSQFISALLMIAPVLANGLTLHLQGTVVSPSYIRMTLQLMKHFGVSASWQGNTIHIPPQSYTARDLYVEADWSAASYYYGMAAFAKEVDLTLEGLQSSSIQGDAVLAELMTSFGVTTDFGENSIRLTKEVTLSPSAQFDHHFIDCPDIAQTLAVVCAGLGVPAHFTGLQTLRIKETDRIGALRQELTKVHVAFPIVGHDHFELVGKASIQNPVFDTYDDHRMAMSLAMLAMIHPVVIRDPDVVEKSYPRFWEDLKQLGFAIREVE